MKIIIISLIAVAMIGLMIPSAFAQSEIPSWIKNNASWWADGQIDDKSFLSGIEFLVDKSIIIIPTNQKLDANGMIELDKYVYDIPKSRQMIEVKLFAKTDKIFPSSVSIQITKPDGQIDQVNLRTTSNMLSYQYPIKNETASQIESDFPPGQYQISIKNGGNVLLGPISFTLQDKNEKMIKQKLVPAWIKNTAGWWGSDTIPDTEFINALQFLIKEKIIKVEQKEDKWFGYNVRPVYQTDVISKNPYTVVLIHTIQNDTCSADDNKRAKAYGIAAEYLVSKNSRPNPTQVTAYCMQINEVTDTTFPYVVKEIGVQMPKLLIYTGGLEGNLETYDTDSNVWTWDCNMVFGPDFGNECRPNQIIVCDECKRWGVHMPDFEDVIDRGIWRLSASIGTSNFYESFGDRWDHESYWFASSTHVWENQDAFDLCYEFGILENELCSKLYEGVTVLGETYLVMDINYARNNWSDEQKQVKKDIIKLVGTGSEFEGFSKFTLREVEGLASESALESISKDVKTTDILSIEYPDDFMRDYYRYDWEIWSYDKDDPDNTEKCCNIFQADNATIKVGADFWKDDTRKDGPQYPWKYLGGMSVWFLDNIHYGGTTDEERFDSLVDSERKYCANMTYGKDQYICRNFKVLEKTIYATDEGRNAYSIVTSYDRGEVNKYGYVESIPYIGTTTEVYVGEDAWQVWTIFNRDVYDFSHDVIDRFNESLILLDSTEPIPSVPVTPSTIVTEDGIQYKAYRAINDYPVWEPSQFTHITNATNITKYKVNCDTNCDISLKENMEVGEVETKIWDGTDLEYDQHINGKLVWDADNEEWVDVEVDKWIYETTDLGQFQDEKIVKQIWDIYSSMTPRQIMEDVDTFLLSTDDRGGGAAFVMNCLDEDFWGCGPPGSPETKFVLSFDPLDYVPISGELQAHYQPGKLKGSLETHALKSVLIHENAHILSLSPSQSDNDLIGYENLIVDGDWSEYDKAKTKQIFTQKAAACAPNHYDAVSGCLKEDSYFNKFFLKFWADIYLDYRYWFEFGDDYGIESNRFNHEFHQKYYDQFVSRYAATHPAEDFAESFHAFVLWDDELINYYKEKCDKVGWVLTIEEKLPEWEYCPRVYRDNSIWEEKIQFFYDFPELVEMRDFMRSNL